MHPLKPLFLIGIGTVAATADTNPVCSAASTVYVTVPASPTSPTTETIYANSKGSSINEGGLATSAGITTTTTTSVVSTQVLSIVPGLPVAEGQASYSFSEQNGTTMWLGGKTPPATVSLNIKTSIITLRPVPSGSLLSQGRSTSTKSYLTLSETKTVTPTLIETLTENSNMVSASAKAFSRFGSSGWNTTMSTFIKPKGNWTGTGLAMPTLYQSGTEGKLASPRVEAYPWETFSSKVSRRVKARQVGGIVVATMQGIPISWTNSYDGQTPATASSYGADYPTTSTFAAPIDSWDLIPTSSPTQSTSSSSMTLRITVSIYPWGISSDSSPSATTTPSLCQSTMTCEAPTARSSMSIVLKNTIQPRTTTQSFSSTMYSKKSTASNSAVIAAPSSCGDAAAGFTIDFDDLPHFSTGPTDTDVPPIFNPYRKLFFDGNFGYVPPPSDPFPPHSPPQLAIYREGEGAGVTGSPDEGLELNGEIGAGPRALDSAYWIDASSAWLGCNNGGQADCTITINGYTNGSTVPIVTQTVTQPPCLKNCSLALVKFHEDFVGLTGLQILAAVADRPVTWYMDDLSLAWTNNTCAAQLERSSAE